MAATIAEAKAYCPVFKNGACPFATNESKALMAKFTTLPGFGPKKCPYNSEAHMGTLTGAKFDAIVAEVLGTSEGAAMSDDLKKFQAICRPLITNHKGCPHFDNMAGAAAKAKSQCPAFKDGGCPMATAEIKGLLSKFQTLPGYGPKQCPHAASDSLGTLTKDKFDAIIAEALATNEGAAMSDDLKKFQSLVHPIIANHKGCPYLENVSSAVRKAKTQCPAFKDGACPFVTDETKALMAKFTSLPGFGPKKCPHSSKESLGSITRPKFDKIVADVLATAEGAAMASDLKRFQEICAPLLDNHKGCPHFQ